MKASAMTLEGKSESRSVVSDSLQPIYSPWNFATLYSPWNSPGNSTGVGNLSLLQEIFPTQGSNPGLPYCRQILHQLSHKGSPRIVEWLAYPFYSWSSWPRNPTALYCNLSAALLVDSLPTELSEKPLKVIFTFWLLKVIYVTLCLINVLNFQFSNIIFRANWAMLSRSVMSDSAIPWTVASQAPLSMRFSRQEYWNELACLL